MPSDIYQARAIAQLAIHFNWTWIGAVVANNDYGHMAVKVFQSVFKNMKKSVQRNNIYTHFSTFDGNLKFFHL